MVWTRTTPPTPLRRQLLLRHVFVATGTTHQWLDDRGTRERRSKSRRLRWNRDETQGTLLESPQKDTSWRKPWNHTKQHQWKKEHPIAAQDIENRARQHQWKEETRRWDMEPCVVACRRGRNKRVRHNLEDRGGCKPTCYTMNVAFVKETPCQKQWKSKTRMFGAVIDLLGRDVAALRCPWSIRSHKTSGKVAFSRQHTG